MDIISGDWNQGYRLLGETLTNVVRLHHCRGGQEVRWVMSGTNDDFHLPSPGIRTIFFNWPSYADSGEQIRQEMNVKETRKFDRRKVTDFGLRETDCDSHTPSFFFIQKSRKLTHASTHVRTAEGRRKDAQRRKEKRAKRRRASASAAAAAEYAAGDSAEDTAEEVEDEAHW